MIQRMQSLNLLIAALTALFYVYYSGVTNLAIASGVVAIICLILIFLYKNRNLQYRLCNLAIAAIIVLVSLMLYQFLEQFMVYSIHFAFPVIMLINVLLAMTYIKKDENLVKSIDRIR